MTQASTPKVPNDKLLLHRVVGPSEEHEEINKMAHGVVEVRSDEVFSRYHCHSLKWPNIKCHPGDIVEAGCLAAQLLPTVTYPLLDALPREIVDTGNLSDLQLEGILFACQRHQVILPNGQRAGFFIGDGAGVGKGRQVSGIILDNFARGRCKHIWFSISTDLKVDAQRDLNDIGCYIKVIEGCQQLDKDTKVFGLPPDSKEGVVFSTYATLVSSVQKGSGRQSRLQQLMDWCGGEKFDGCLIFDECHKAKHFIPGKEENSTKIALAVTTLQRMLPKARVVYCSATGVTDVKNMAFMERLGLWGEGTAFKSFESFLESITKRGLGAAEMLAMEMKASAMYVSRGLSFRQAEFSNVEAPLTDDQVKVYDTAVHVWNELRKSLEYAIARTNTASPRMWSQFWSCHQRFFKQLCMSMKVPMIVAEAKSALQEGYSVVIGLQTTGEASLESELNRNGGRITRFISITEEIMTRFITQYFPVKISSGTAVEKEDKWSAAAKDLLLGFVKKISLPISPLDDLIDKLGGPGCVAEMTGRRGRVVRTAHDREPHYEARETESSQVDSLNIQERNSFMNGSKLVAIISDAASTGISLHSDLRVANQRRRVHITIELPWSADKAVQQLGRSHRSNQSSGPVYKLMTTNLGGERRFAAAVARRLQSLGALTKGDRRAATGADLTQFNFDTTYGRSALRSMYQAISMNQLSNGVLLHIIQANVPGSKTYDFVRFNEVMRECLMSMGLTDTGSSVVKDKEAGDVSRFLNRILGLSVERQNLIFSYFSECLNANIETAKREGKYNEGVTDLSASSITMIGSPCPVFTDVKGIMPTQHVTLCVDRGIEWSAALQRFHDSAQGKLDGFYYSKREQRGQRFYLLALQKENSSHLFNIIRPNTGQSPFEEEKTDLLNKYIKITPDEAEKGWRLQYERTKDHCFHGPGCRTGLSCRVGCRISRVHLLCGGIVPILSTLEWVVSRHAERASVSREERTLRVMRVELDGGQRLVGLRYPERLIPVVTSLLKEQQTDVNGLLGTQNALMGLSLPNQKTSKTSLVESVSIVNPRTLAKAINPPVTIKNYFRPKAPSGKTKESYPESAVHDENNPGNNVDAEVTAIMDKAATTEISEDRTQGTQSSRPSSASGDRTQATRSSRPSSVSSTPARALSTKGSKSSKGKKGRPASVPVGKGAKRAAADVAENSTKRQKQSSIFASLSKSCSKDGTQNKRKEMNCPICNKKFEEESNNSTINKHIDNCLID